MAKDAMFINRDCLVAKMKKLGVRLMTSTKVLGVDETDEDDEKILELSNEVFDVSLEDDEEDIFDDEKESSEDEEENAEGSDFEEDDE